MPRSRERVSWAWRPPVCLGSRDDSERTHRRTGAVDKLEGRGDQDRALGRQLIEIAEARKAVAIGLVDEIVRGEWWVHAAGRACIRTDRFRSPPDDVFRQQIFDRFRSRPWRMGPFVVGVEEGLRRPVAL